MSVWNNAVTANAITVSRVPLSLAMLVLPPRSVSFAACYLLCGVTDVMDGFAARKLHAESEKGAMLDSMADLLFAVIYAVKILPLLNIPLWIWIWTAIIGAIKITGIFIASRNAHRMMIEHSFGNKLTGLLLYLLPLSVWIVDVKYGAAFVCITATVTVLKEFYKEFSNDDVNISL